MVLRGGGLGSIKPGIGAVARRSNSSCVPVSAIRPRSMTTRRLARLSVLRRWAMAIVVRPRMRLSRANWISRSVSVSTDEVASSRIKMRGSINSARAMLIRCRSPPESDWPRSPTSES